MGRTRFQLQTDGKMDRETARKIDRCQRDYYIPRTYLSGGQKYPVKKMNKKNLETPFSPYKVYRNAKGQLTLAWKIGSG